MPSRPDPLSLNQRLVNCVACPRLIAHCRAVAEKKRAAYRDQAYHGKPVPNFLPGRGDAKTLRAALLIVGLAPGAHGANRTGRMFTGDRSGDFLYRSLHQAGLCNQPTSVNTGDGLRLKNTVITAAVHCAPPDNKPTRDEFERCAGYLAETIDVMPRLRVAVTLGKLAHDALLREAIGRGWIGRMKDCPFGHTVEHVIERSDTTPAQPLRVIGSYHPSQQNTFTGRLTQAMLDEVFLRAAELAE